MSRPKCCRRVAGLPDFLLFKPAGLPAAELEEIVLTMDEFEALRLADLLGLYQEQAAAGMHISRQTFGRILEGAHHKVARALVEGKILRIDGGKVEMPTIRKFQCFDCQHIWTVPYGTGRPGDCPACHRGNICRVEAERGPGGPGAGGPSRRCRRGQMQK